MDGSESDSGRFGELQLAILRVLWEEGEATVESICEGLRPDHDVAYSTVSTVLSRLLGRGVVSREKRGRSYVYRAEVDEAEVRGSMVGRLLDRVFGGDASELVSHLVRSRELEGADLDRLRALIEEERD